MLSTKGLIYIINIERIIKHGLRILQRSKGCWRAGKMNMAVLPEEFPFLETETDFEVTIEVAESEACEACIAEFVKLTKHNAS